MKSGPWKPPVFPKQKDVLSACIPGRGPNHILLSGPRWCGKTQTCHHAVCQHAWLIDRANICLLTITQSVGVDSGIWQHLTETFLPSWMAPGFGMNWIRRPYTQAVTKKPTCIVTNRHGTWSRISLESLRNEDEVEARFKGKNYTMIWVNELSKFKKRETFDALKQQLRTADGHLPDDHMLFLADTNPDLDLGTKSWIYKLWWTFGDAIREELIEMFPDRKPEEMQPLQKQLKRFEFTLDDNLWLTPEKKARLLSDFSHSDVLRRAYYLGEWVTAPEQSLFFEVFRPAFHVVPDNEDEVMVPQTDCVEIIQGWDPGGRNCAVTFLEKVNNFVTVKNEDTGKTEEKNLPIIKCLDEVAWVGHDFDLYDFVEEVVRRMRFWERIVGRKVQWRMWSDRMVFDIRVPFSDRYWHQHIFEASDGLIELNATTRGKGTVQYRVDLLRKLLYLERFFISRARCPDTIRMLTEIRRGKGPKQVIEIGSPHKHIFDAITYAASAELEEEMDRSVRLKLHRVMGREHKLFSISL